MTMRKVGDAISGWASRHSASSPVSERTESRFGVVCSVAFVAVNADQAEDWNGASGRRFIEQRERWERMRGRLTARLLAGADPGRGERSRHRVRLR
jgi:hypothetical protein